MKFEFYNEMKFKCSFYKNFNNDGTSQAPGSLNPIKSNHHSVCFFVHSKFAHRRIN